VPTNFYGSGDNYEFNDSHVLLAVIRKFHEGRAKGEDSIPL
jgi:GDP-L-fucose synthetase